MWKVWIIESEHTISERLIIVDVEFILWNQLKKHIEIQLNHWVNRDTENEIERIVTGKQYFGLEGQSK